MSPDSRSFEARWFTPRKPRVPFEARRGYRPPPASNGLVFTGLSLLLVAMGVTAIVVFFSPPESKHVRPVEATVASADVVPTPIEPPAAPVPAAEPMATKETPQAPPPRVASPPRAKAPAPTKGVPEFKIKN